MRIDLAAVVARDSEHVADSALLQGLPQSGVLTAHKQTVPAVLGGLGRQSAHPVLGLKFLATTDERLKRVRGCAAHHGEA